MNKYEDDIFKLQLQYKFGVCWKWAGQKFILKSMFLSWYCFNCCISNNITFYIEIINGLNLRSRFMLTNQQI